MVTNHGQVRVGEKPIVLHIFSGDLWAGAEVMIFNLLSELNNSKTIDVLAICLNEGVLADKLRSIGLQLYVIPENNHSLLGVLHVACSLLAGKKIGVIHSHRYKENLLALLLSMKLGGCRLVATMHGLPELLESRSRWGQFKTLYIYNTILKYWFGCVVAVSHNIRNALIEEEGFSSEAVRVIHNGIPLPLEAGGKSIPDSHSVHIGSVGRMVPVKDFGLFLEIAAVILRKADNVVFSILGDGPLRDELCQRARALGIAERVKFVFPMRDPASFYQSLDIYLNTSLHEGIPLSILEAMSYMKPIVAPMVGGIPEILDHEKTGIMLRGRDPRQYADACLKLLGNPVLRQQLGEAGRRTVSAHFSSAQMAAHYHMLYEA